MSNNTLVSIIMPFYNTEVAFIKEAIDSVFIQSHSNWELLLVNDGSSVEVTQFAKCYSIQFPERISYCEHDNYANKGNSAARNLGIKLAKGEYIAFLDSDDIWIAQSLQNRVSILDTHPEVGMLYGNTKYWYSWTGKVGMKNDFIPDLGVNIDTVYPPPTLLTKFLDGSAAVPSINSLLVCRKAIERTGGFDESFRSSYGDQHFYAKQCIGEYIYVSGECFDQYRQHPESMTYRNRKKEISLRESYLSWLYEYMKQKSVNDFQVWNALKREMWLIHSPAWIKNYHLRRILRWLKKWILIIKQY